MILLPWLYGKALLRLCYRQRKKEYFFPEDSMLTGYMVLVGLAETAHLAAVFLRRSFSDCVMLFLLLLAMFAVLSLGILLLERKPPGSQRKNGQEKQIFPVVLFAILILGQVILIAMGNHIYLSGDMTLETVKSFLATDSIYQVNPLTGKAYHMGMPSRLKILCLPTLYGALSRLYGMDPQTLIWIFVPIITLLMHYLAYYSVARALFGEDAKKRLGFMIIVALLVWMGDYLFGMEGFGLLHAGYRGVTIRGAVLVPYTIGLMLRGKKLVAFLCMAAEACMVWTLYGMGYCVLAAVVMGGIHLFLKRKESTRKSDEGNGTASLVANYGNKAKEDRI